MRDVRSRSSWPLLISMLAVVPLAVLPLRAVADVWRAPALLPQRLGTRGFDWLVSPGARINDAVTTSVAVAMIATALGVVLAWPAARTLSRLAAGRRSMLLAALAVPLLVPPFATGTGLATWFLRLGLADRLVGLIAAHLVYVLPYAVLILAPAFDGSLLRLEEAARTSGAAGLRRLWHVTVPALARPLMVAALLGFLVSWSQYGTSLAVGGGRLTLPVVLLPFVEHDPQVSSALALIFVLPPLVVLAAMGRWWRDAR